MMGISRNGSRVLCFVIDTTGSMSDDIAAVRETTSLIIDSKRGTPDEPSAYILVPFNDPGERWDALRMVSCTLLALIQSSAQCGEQGVIWDADMMQPG